MDVAALHSMFGEKCSQEKLRESITSVMAEVGGGKAVAR